MRCLTLAGLVLPALIAAAPAFADAASCDTGDFAAFLQRFSREITVQEASTVDPLPYDLLDPLAEAEPWFIRSESPASELLWPIIPDLRLVSPEQYVMEVSEEGAEMAVLLRGANNGERTTWYFAAAPCWQLVRIKDESM